MKDIVSNSKITMYIALFNLAAGPVLLLEGPKTWLKIFGFILIAFGVYCVNFLIHAIEILCKFISEHTEEIEKSTDK